MLCSFILDLIPVKVKCDECLCEKKRMRDWMKSWGCYIVLLQSSGKMLCSLWTDLIAVKVQCGKCLYETKKNERLDEKVGMLHCSVAEQWQDVVHLHP
jgi:hypothetical protein